MWLVCAVLVPLLALGVIAEGDFLIVDAIEGRFSGFLLSVFLFSIAALVVTVRKMNGARKRMTGIGGDA